MELTDFLWKEENNCYSKKKKKLKTSFFSILPFFLFHAAKTRVDSVTNQILNFLFQEFSDTRTAKFRILKDVHRP